MNEINDTLAKGAVPAMEASIAVHFGSVDMELEVCLLGEVDTGGKVCKFLAVRITELMLKDLQVTEES